MNIEEFKKIISKLLPVTITEKGNKLIIELKKFPIPKSWELEVEAIEGIIQKLRGKKVLEETTIYDENSYETLVKFESSARTPLFRLMFRKEPLIIRDTENEIVYKLSQPSDEYLIFF